MIGGHDVRLLPTESCDAPALTAEERPIPRYFFHIQDGYSIRDTEGTELPDIYAVQDQAIRTSGEILRDMGAKFWDGTEWTMEVADEQGQILLVLRFSAEERITLTDPGSNSGTP